MSQISFIRTESRQKGIKRTIKLPAIAAGAFKQYQRTDAKLAEVISSFGYFNQITVLNNGDVDVEFSLDFSDLKTYPVPASSSLGLDEIMYQEFNVTNLDAANPTVADKITIICSYENPLLREKMKTKKQMYMGGL